jgi:hypothetical protein
VNSKNLDVQFSPQFNDDYLFGSRRENDVSRISKMTIENGHLSDRAEIKHHINVYHIK